MKRIKKRRRRLRINNPIGFSLFCILCLALLAGLIIGVYYLVQYGPGACTAIQEYFEEQNATPTPAPSPTPTLPPTLPPATDPPNTPVVGDEQTPTPETSTPTLENYTPAPPTADPNAPLYGFTIGLDPFRDSGSQYKAEAEYNLAFALKFKAYLEQRGATVVVTRENSSESYSVNERTSVINEANCDVAIRILCNHLSSRGTVGCYAQALSKNEEMARTIIDAYVASTGLETRKQNGFEAKSVDFFKKTDCPAINIIIGHWTNAGELEKLQDEAFQQLMMEGLYNGLLEYLK